MADSSKWLDKLQVGDKVLILSQDGTIYAVGVIAQNNQGTEKGRVRPIMVIPQGVFNIRTLPFSGKTGRENRGNRFLAAYNSARAKAWEEFQAAAAARARAELAAKTEQRKAALLEQLAKVDWQIVLEDFGETALKHLEQVVPAYVKATEKGHKELDELYEAAHERFKDPLLQPYHFQALDGDLNRETLQWLVEEASEEDIIAWCNGELA